MAVSNDGSIILKTKVDTSGVEKGMGSIQSIVTKVGGLLAAAFSVRVLTNFAKESINLASDLQEVQNVVDTAFGSMAYKIENFTKNSIEQFGLGELAAKQWSSTMMAMGTGMGQAMEVGSDMAVELTGRLADVMSFYNKTEEEAFTLGKAIYSGETEPLKNIGIIMTENNLALFAMSKGYKTAYKDMDAANKLLVRQQYFLEKTSLAAGDYAKTQDGWANSTRTLQQQYKEMQTVWGEAFMAIGTLFLPAVHDLITLMTKLARITSVAAQNIYKMFTGKDLNFGTTSQQIEGVGDTTADAASGVEDLGNATEEANKKMKKSLAGFDDLQIISSSISKDTSDSAENMFGLGANITEAGSGDGYGSEVEKIDEALGKIMLIIGASLAAVGIILLFNGAVAWGAAFIIAGAATLAVSAAALGTPGDTQQIANYLSTLMGIAAGALLAIGIFLIYMGSLGWGIGCVVIGLAIIGVKIYTSAKSENTSDIETWLNTIQGIAAGATLALGVLLLMFGGPALKLTAIGLLAVGAIGLVMNIANNSESALSDEVKSFFDKFIVITSTIMLVLGMILLAKGSILIGVSLIATGAIALVKELAQMGGSNLSQETQDFINNLVVVTSYVMLALGILLISTGVNVPLGIGLIVTGVTGMVAEVVINPEYVKELINGTLGDVITNISAIALALGVVLLCCGQVGIGIGLMILGGVGMYAMTNTSFGVVEEIVKQRLTNITDIIAGFSLALGVILLFCGMVPQGLALIALGIGGAFLGSSVKNMDTGASEIEKQIEEELKSINEAAQAGVDEVNETLSQIQFSGGGGSFSGYGASRSFGDQSYTYTVPKLAQGAVLPANKPFLAMVGDQKNGTNVEAPLSTIEEAVANVMGRQGGGSSTVIMQIDGREFGRAVIDQGDRENRRIGTRLVTT